MGIVHRKPVQTTYKTTVKHAYNTKPTVRSGDIESPIKYKRIYRENNREHVLILTTYTHMPNIY